jgi:hypothetical protein
MGTKSDPRGPSIFSSDEPTMYLTQPQNQSTSPERTSFLKKLFWVYFVLLIFEGALRKWIAPQLSAPLLLVRDPVAILIIWEAYRTNKWPRKWSAITAVLCVGLVGLCVLQLVIASNPWFVALYGLRSYLLPFPVAFIMGENLDAEDLHKFGKWTLLLLLPLTLLEVAQYLAPAGSILNKGATVGSEQLAYSGGHLRASATFSYVAGPANYVPMAAAFLFYGLANPQLAKRWLLWAASAALVLSIPIVGSRTILFMLAAIVGTVVLAALFGVSQFTKAIQTIVTLVFISCLMAQLPIFSDATNSFMSRWTESSSFEGTVGQSIILRVVAPITSSLDESISRNDLFGIGMGYGSGAVAQLLTGRQGFLAGEGEVERVVIEFGWPCGLAFMLFRCLLAFMILVKAIGRAREHQLFAWLLSPLTFAAVSLGTLEQPTEQGFAVIVLAFTLAALRRDNLASQSAILDPRLKITARNR